MPHLSWSYDIVHVLQKSLILDFIICENKCDSLSSVSSSPVQYF